MTTNSHLPRPTWAFLAAAAALACSAVLAQTPKEIAAQFATDIAACKSRNSQQERAACMDEARSVAAESRRGVLGDGMAPDSANLTKRCLSLPDKDRTACMARMKGEGTVSGSVAAGGILRELVTVEPAPPIATETKQKP
jgi:hypothetical protein